MQSAQRANGRAVACSTSASTVPMKARRTEARKAINKTDGSSSLKQSTAVYAEYQAYCCNAMPVSVHAPAHTPHAAWADRSAQLAMLAAKDASASCARMRASSFAELCFGRASQRLSVASQNGRDSI
eukprot:CAMPEP_0183374434 /NCGR_PEP_ID=MMETSP0164_2-20130417/114480_1 /TAXON_ID=221442 /ORGANISM="Coccolithus pelagicus ssp braarudi, Strain PLY182g" /LENGTH=126 /DNA_ID=CAMNT_0025551467 /DNA_START=313 /DNA_END=693 /DNA_ORIENTATION=+